MTWPRTEPGPPALGAGVLPTEAQGSRPAGFLKAAALLRLPPSSAQAVRFLPVLSVLTFWVLTVALLMCVKWGACIREFCALVSGVLSVSTKYSGAEMDAIQ